MWLNCSTPASRCAPLKKRWKIPCAAGIGPRRPWNPSPVKLFLPAIEKNRTMNPKPRNAFRNQWRVRTLLTGIALGLLAGWQASAQDVLMAQPQYSITPPALQQLETNDL